MIFFKCCACCTKGLLCPVKDQHRFPCPSHQDWVKDARKVEVEDNKLVKKEQRND